MNNFQRDSIDACLSYLNLHSITTSKDPLGHPLVYHPLVESDLEYWATRVLSAVSHLKSVTERTVRQAHFAAPIVWRGDGDCPVIYNLAIGALQFFYSIESEHIVIRGYAVNCPTELLPEDEPGGYYCEPGWDDTRDKNE